MTSKLVVIITTLVTFALSADAEITKTSGDVKIIEAPADVRTGRLESDEVARLFVEKTQVELPQAVTLDITRSNASAKAAPRSGEKGKSKKKPDADPALSQQTLATGRLVNSYYIHFDGIGENEKTVTGSISFREKILGVIIESEGLVATNSTLGTGATQYPPGSPQDGESAKNTEITISPGRRMISFKLAAGKSANNLRVVTDAAASKKATGPRQKDVASSDTDQDDPPKGRGKQNKHKSPGQTDGLLQVPSRWSGTRTNSSRGHTGNCQVRVVKRQGDVYLLEFTEHHSKIKLTMTFKVTGNTMTLVGWKNNSIADITIEGFQAQGSTDGQGMQIGYQWVQSDTIVGRHRGSVQNGLVKGSIDVTRDP